MTLEQIDGSGNPNYYLHDWQGSTLELVNSSGTKAATYPTTPMATSPQHHPRLD
ncbi:MAG: hypothetical protein WBA31_05910 [Candidatus Dormiibacterota bacterium]